ncbi:alcohol dehydrogenase-like 6 isoform X2 [Zingiber officinale]|uniref:alcohol dehydrogenase-like 6 isoform X2 n=1 Tax=Zingiber officinale TaxID=94328 RepID=UPI001C4D4020|nr:alcohol dehydrogenase-like 6 isoform X2 [Zingiber officinale]
MSASIQSSGGVITCRAAVAWGPGQPLVLEEVEVAPPKSMEIRVKVVCTSLCRSDVTQWQSQAQPDLFPRIFGHEASGIVEGIGDGVTEFEIGDHVLTVFIGECGRCTHCRSSKSNMCQNLGLERRGLMHSDQMTRFRVKGRPAYHYCAVSSFSEYIVVHSGCAVKINPTVRMDRACLLSCGVAAGIGAAWNVADISKESTVVIFGLGTVGLSVAQAAKIRGASRIIGVDINPEKFEKGKTFGVTEYINPDECREPVQQGWGVTVTLGVPKTKPEVSTHYAFLLTGRTLKGSLFGGWKPKSDLPSLVDKYSNGEIELDEFVTHDIPFERINDAFDLMREGSCLRCVIHMQKEL